ncbi:MAG: radical SAM protein [Methanoregula sp.]|jgi:putative pyruvate formate lyase activating enzyme|nr:radical SAM protein [Methanoregula sp.]
MDRTAIHRILYPSYVALSESGELAERIERAYALLASCTVCPRKCRVNRLNNERGFCRTGLFPVISSFGPHFGEEPPLVGRQGSGTIFFTCCNLTCEYCQNYTISQTGTGETISCETLAGMMLDLQRQGCHNINLVSPSHVVPQILNSLGMAAEQGLNIPIVYNSGGYDSVDTLRLLEGIVDIYMPDAKYGSDEIAQILSHTPDYVVSMKTALKEMYHQVGDLVIEKGIAVRGLIIRHLVLPENLAGSDSVLPWIAEEISRDAYVNIMDQYHWPRSIIIPELFKKKPEYRALLRPITEREYEDAVRWAKAAGLHRGF